MNEQLYNKLLEHFKLTQIILNNQGETGYTEEQICKAEHKQAILDIEIASFTEVLEFKVEL